MEGGICKQQRFIFKVGIIDNMLYWFYFVLSNAGFECGCCSVMLVANGAFSCPSLSEGQFLFMVI